MNDCFDPVGARFADYLPNGVGVIENGRLIQGPQIGPEVYAGAPVFEPYVVSPGYEVIDQRSFGRRAKQVGAHPGTVNQQHGTAASGLIAGYMEQVAGESVPRCERNQLGIQ